MLTPEQCRAARGWLAWNQAELAERAGLGLSTVRDFEGGRRTPIRNNLEAMRAVFAAAGLQFTQSADGRPLGLEAAPATVTPASVGPHTS